MVFLLCVEVMAGSIDSLYARPKKKKRKKRRKRGFFAQLADEMRFFFLKESDGMMSCLGADCKLS